MKETKDLRTNEGITLIALVITIIVMLILVGVTISMAVNGGLFNYAGKASGETKNALSAEGQLADGGIEVDGVWYNSIDEYLETKNGGEAVETISKETEYVGCYADVDGDGTVDGVIYADLAFSKSGNWNSESYSYEATPAEELKDYYVSGTYDGDFNKEGEPKDVLTATGTGNDRFYVMALEDFTEEGDLYCWYYSLWDYVPASGSELTTVGTSQYFGSGKANTVAMIEKWNTSEYGTQNGHATYKDVWGSIQNSEEYEIVESENDSGKWFVPSKDEWSAFYGALIAPTLYETLDRDAVAEQIGLTYNIYITSSEMYMYPKSFWEVDTMSWWVNDSGMVESPYSLRLVATF